MVEDLLEDMDQDGGTGEAGSPDGRKGAKGLLGNKKRLILLVLAAVLVLAAAAGVWVFFFSSSQEDGAALQPPPAQDMAVQDPKDEIIFEDIVVLAPFERIPLKGGSAMGMISLTVALELVDHRFRKQVYTVQDRLGRVVTAKVREMTWRELRNPEGKIRLKYELLRQMNSIFPKVTIRNIYFTNFLMQ